MGTNEEAKLFVGGLPQETTKESLKYYFARFGTVVDAVVMYDNASGRSRGFGFVTFDKADIIDSILASAQVVDGKEVDCKRACPREVMAARQFGGPHYSPQQSNFKTSKIFVGGLPDLTTDEFRNYFSKYGKVVDAVLMTDKNSNRPRGFGFITYESTDVVDEVVRKFHDHQIKDKWVEVKKAQSREQLTQRGGPMPGMGRGGYGGMGYGAPPYAAYYDGYGPRGGAYPPYDARRPYGAPAGYDPYGPPGPGYGAGAYGPSDGAGGRRPYSPYGPSRAGGAGGSYRGVPSGDPFGGMNSGMNSGMAYGGHGGQVGAGGGASSYGAQPGAASAYAATGYGGSVGY